MNATRFDCVSKQFTLHYERARSLQELFLDVLHARRASSKEIFRALDSVSFEIKRGEMTGIIGANGAGKSTILKLVSRILEPTSGHIEVNGRVSALLELGAGFHPDLTGRENVFLNGSILGISRPEMARVFDDIVSFSDMQKFIDIPVKNYSSGMFMRLGFSVAIHIKPEILLVDEVLAVGDQSFQLRCLDRITDMKRQGVTIIFVTHDLRTVRNLCDRAIWLDDGQVRADGKVDRVIDQYVDHALFHNGSRSTDAGSERAEQAPMPDDSTTWRLGSREAEIVRVQLLDGEARERQRFRTGETFIARMHYVAHHRIERPVFGAAMHRADGFHICGPNTGTSGYAIDAIEGNGYIDFIVPSLPLLPGAFLFSAAIYDQGGTRAYDHHVQAYGFRVTETGGMQEEYGTLRIDGQWRLSNDTRKELNGQSG
jgi:lipopolysaccharide transport system ATP-binding protein